MTTETKDNIKRVLKRFLRGFGASFVTAMGTLSQSQDYSSAAITSLFIAAVAGGLLAAEKLLRSY